MPIVPFAVAAIVKASLFTLCSSIQVEGLDNLLAALASGKGVLTGTAQTDKRWIYFNQLTTLSLSTYHVSALYANTLKRIVSNHISVLDDPCAFSVAMPLRTFLDRQTTRWTLGASDIVFTNMPRRFFFKAGQVIETYRSSAAPDKAGIYQVAIDEAIRKLDRAQWLHIFPEAKVHQHPEKRLIRFRWGVSRILMETKNEYEVIPIWLEGFDDLMPLERTFPRFIPRFWRANLRIVIGPPCTSRIVPLVDEYRAKAGGPVPLVDMRSQGLGKDGRPRPPKYEGDTEEAKEARVKIASALKEEVEKLGGLQCSV